MGHEAIQLYRRMPVGMKDERANVCVLNACSHSGLVDECRSIFAKIPAKSNYIYTAMVTKSILTSTGENTRFFV